MNTWCIINVLCYLRQLRVYWKSQNNKTVKSWHHWHTHGQILLLKTTLKGMSERDSLNYLSRPLSHRRFWFRVFDCVHWPNELQVRGCVFWLAEVSRITVLSFFSPWLCHSARFWSVARFFSHFPLLIGNWWKNSISCECGESDRGSEHLTWFVGNQSWTQGMMQLVIGDNRYNNLHDV